MYRISFTTMGVRIFLVLGALVASGLGVGFGLGLASGDALASGDGV
jgi:hypothetical protein